MKKTISLLALGALTAFCTVNAQDKQQTESTSTDHAEETYQQQSQNVQDQDKKEIDESELPDQVKQSLQESEYADMDIIVAYEVEESGNVSQNKGKTIKWNEAQSQTSDTTQSYVDKGVEYDAETGYSTSPGEEQTYPNTEYGTSQTDQNQQTSEMESADRLNEGDQQRQNDQLDLEDDPKPVSQSQTSSSDNMSDSEKMYEVQVEAEDKVMILVFTEEGELRQATEGEDGM